MWGNYSLYCLRVLWSLDRSMHLCKRVRPLDGQSIWHNLKNDIIMHSFYQTGCIVGLMGLVQHNSIRACVRPSVRWSLGPWCFRSRFRFSAFLERYVLRIRPCLINQNQRKPARAWQESYRVASSHRCLKTVPLQPYNPFRTSSRWGSEILFL